MYHNLRFEASWDQWSDILNWCDEMTPGWYFTLDRLHGGHIRERLANPTDRMRRDYEMGGASISFETKDELMMFKLAWTGME